MFDEGFFWEELMWPFSNLDDSGGNEEKSCKNLIESSRCNEEEAKEKGVAPPVEEEKKSVGCKKGKRKVGQGSEKKGGGDGGNGGGEGGETHIWTERERRKRMKNMFANLHALLPQLPPKTDKSSIVDETVSYIRTLQHTLQNLQKKKLEKLQTAKTMNYHYNNTSSPSIKDHHYNHQGSSSSSNNSSTFRSWTSPNVSLDVCGDDAHISVCSSKKAGLLSAICFLFDKYKLEVVSAQVSSDHFRSMYMFQVHANAGYQFLMAFPVEEIFKQAVGEIMFLVAS